MIFDNKIIITKDNRKSGKITVKPDEPGVLIRCVGNTEKCDIKVNVTRSMKSGGVAFDELPLSTIHQKIKVAPFESIELEIPDWRKIPLESEFHFNLITGTQHELLFYDLNQTIHAYDSGSDRKKFAFLVGNGHGSSIKVIRVFKGYECDIYVNNKSFRLQNKFTIEPKTCLEKMALDIHSQIEAIKEHFDRGEGSAYTAGQKEARLNNMLNRHFKPIIY